MGDTSRACEGIRERVRLLEVWRNGNGARGAETRLQAIERKAENNEEVSVKALETIESHQAWHDKTDKRIWAILGMLVANLLIPIVLKFVG